MRSSLAILLGAFLAAGNLSSVLATPAESLSAQGHHVTAGHMPVGKNFAHPVKAGRKWDTKTPKLENLADKAKKRNKRVSTFLSRLIRTPLIFACLSL